MKSKHSFTCCHICFTGFLWLCINSKNVALGQKVTLVAAPGCFCVCHCFYDIICNALRVQCAQEMWTIYWTLDRIFSLNKEMIAIKDSYFGLCTCFPERTVMVCTEWFFITFNCHIKEYLRRGLNKDDLMKEVSVLFKNVTLVWVWCTNKGIPLMHLRKKESKICIKTISEWKIKLFLFYLFLKHSPGYDSVWPMCGAGVWDKREEATEEKRQRQKKKRVECLWKDDGKRTKLICKKYHCILLM